MFCLNIHIRSTYESNYVALSATYYELPTFTLEYIINITAAKITVSRVTVWQQNYEPEYAT